MFTRQISLLLTALLLLTTPVLAAEWRYTDGAGKSVVLPAPPTRIIAHSTVAAALMPYGIVPVGILRDGPPSLDRSLDGLDLADIPIVSRGWFEIDAEAVLKLDPDIIITEYSTIEHIYQGGTHEGAIAERLDSIAPTIGIPRTNSIVDMLDAYRDFAESLGADTDTPALAADRARFDAAVRGLEALTAAKPDLTVLALSPGESSLSLAVPALFGELNDFTRWGVKLVTPKATPGTSYLTVSWENAETYAADILLLDDRWDTSSYALLTAHPMGQRLAAVAANQMGDWPAEWIRTYGTYAQEIEALTALIERSEGLGE